MTNAKLTKMIENMNEELEHLVDDARSLRWTLQDIELSSQKKDVKQFAIETLDKWDSLWDSLEAIDDLIAKINRSME